MIDGHRYWCCKQSIESESYGHKPCKPWEGILKISCMNASLRLHRFNSNGEIDDDPNATAIVTEEDLFLCKEDAIRYYRKKCVEYAKKLQEQAIHYFNEAMSNETQW